MQQYDFDNHLEADQVITHGDICSGTTAGHLFQLYSNNLLELAHIPHE